MTRQRILQLSDMYGQRRARRKTLIEAVCILGLGFLASWLAIGCIEWVSTWRGRW